MSIKARLIYILIILFINGYSNSVGNTVIPFITIFLFFIILIPPLSRITKFNLLHEKLFEFVSKASEQTSTNESLDDSGNDDSSDHRELFFDSEAPAELDYEEHVDGINDPSITTSISRRPAKIFARGYQLKVDQGIWYELYVKNRDDGPMSYEPLDDKELQMKEAIEGAYLGSFLSELKDYGQCTFYVSNKQEVLTLDKFLTCMESVYVNPDDGSEFDQTLFNNNLKFLKITSDIYKKKD